MPDLAPSRILVTGAAGFIGMHQAKRLLEAGHRVLGVDNLSPYYSPALKRARLAELARYPAFEFVEAGIEDAAAMAAMFTRFSPEYVVHLAAQAGVRHSLVAPFDYASANLTGFLSLIEAARHFPVKHFLYASSSSVYGANAKVPFSETDPVDHPISLYAATKRANEMMAQTYAHLFHIPLTGLRFFTVYGPWGRPDMAPWGFTNAILMGTPIDVYDEATTMRDFTHVDDVTRAISALLPLAPEPTQASANAPHRILNIGNSQPERLSDFIAAIENACGRKAIKNHCARPAGDVPATYADSARMAALTGFMPEIKIGDGMADFVRWFRDYRDRA